MYDTLKGDVFIVPNRQDSCGVQIWVTSKENQNWSDHKYQPEGVGSLFPTRLHYKILDGVKEGDTFCIEWGWRKVELTAKQLDYRYSSHGRFEEVFERVRGM